MEHWEKKGSTREANLTISQRSAERLKSATASGTLPAANFFDEENLLPRICDAVEKGRFEEAISNFRMLYANLADRIASAYSENAKDLLRTAQESYALLRVKMDVEPFDKALFYLGQLNAILELATRLIQRTVPYSAVHVVMGSDVAKQIIERLYEEGPLTVTGLAGKLNKAHPYISTLLGRLEAVRVVRRRRFGQAVEIALLPVGRELVLQLRKEQEECATGEEKEAFGSAGKKTAATHYASPEVLVSTNWVAEHLDDPQVRVVEVDVDTKAYGEGHIQGALGWSWQSELSNAVRRDVIPKEELEKLLSESGIGKDTRIVLYGDNNNWFACWAFWQLKMFGHSDVRIMNGGRKKWIEEGRPLTKEVRKYPAKNYKASNPDTSIRAFLLQIKKEVVDKDFVLVDVRSPDEFTGKILSPPGLPETCQRGGHIPGAVNIPWGKNCNYDGTFKSQNELKALYESAGVKPDSGVITYCRIGERSSLTWFVLKYLLGYPKVLNYDGSWTEWGNLVNVPIER